MKKKITIVGGGITGCIAALTASNMGLEVELHEKNNKLGGILQDISFKDLKYFRNCQYLNPYENWFETLIKKNFKTENFHHLKFSFNNLFNREIFSNGIAGLAVLKKLNLKNINLTISSKSTMKKRLNNYPASIASKIDLWLKINNYNISNLSHLSCDGFGVKRIFPLKNLNLIKKTKKKNINFNNLIGLSDKYLKSNKVSASVPSKGYDHFFKEILNLFEKKKINVNLNSVLKPVWNKNRLRLKNKKNYIRTDFIFWSGNPTGLIKSFGLPLLDSSFINSKNYYFELSGKIKNNFYIQIYDLQSAITRIFVYMLDKKLKLTVETMSHETRSSDVINYCNKFFKKYLSEYDLKITSNLEIFDIKKKYVLVSNKDSKIIEKFSKLTKETNLIQGSWLIYSRDEKIKFFKKELKDKIK